MHQLSSSIKQLSLHALFGFNAINTNKGHVFLKELTHCRLHHHHHHRSIGFSHQLDNSIIFLLLLLFNRKIVMMSIEFYTILALHRPFTSKAKANSKKKMRK